MQSQFLLQPIPSQLYDYCQQCQAFHQAQFINGQLTMKPCQYQIRDVANQQKIYTQTNFTSNTHSQSNNSTSTISIQNHLLPTLKPHVVRPDKYKNLYFMNQSNQPPFLYSPTRQSISPHNHLKLHKSNTFSPNNNKHKNQAFKYSPKNQRNLNSHHNPDKVIIPNTLISKSIPQQIINNSQAINQQHQFFYSPNIIRTNNNNTNQSCFQTPQFGSQNTISPVQNKQNSINKNISKQRLNKQQKQFKIPHIKQNQRIDRTISQVQQNDYFCCGYIKKFNK